jgi:membrane protein implicated in regulation of membrane protease activity|tara:strand:- start:2089 stop:2283 length:195 start_codon:yes stop_codon:yes gene_type:complete
VLTTTLVGIGALVVGLLIGWPVLVALSVIFVVVQLLMMGARAAVQRNDRRLAERLEQKRSEREG